jgi:septal ring factor EnvC (AmiA/AmiB activator)
MVAPLTVFALVGVVSQLTALRANMESVKAELALKSSELNKMADELAEMTKQKDILLRTTEQYEHDNRDFQSQVATVCVCVYMYVHVSVCAPVYGSGTGTDDLIRCET